MEGLEGANALAKQVLGSLRLASFAVRRNHQRNVAERLLNFRLQKRIFLCN